MRCSNRIVPTVVALLLAGCVGTAPPSGGTQPRSDRTAVAPTWPAQAAAERLGLDVCRREGIEEPLLCGKLPLPADRRDPEGPEIEVSFIVVPAKNGNPDRLAWTEHGGGPGKTMLPVVGVFAAGGPLEPYRETRDVLIFDQRGVGESGGLHCEALTTPRVLRPYFTPETVAACRDETAAAGLLSADYSTIAAVDDLEALRERLGYDRLDLGGWSYGAKFVLTYAHRYPERVRTIFVAVPSPIDYRRPLDWARFSQAALEGMFEDCEGQPACAAAYPDLRADWARLQRRIARDPPKLEFVNPYTGKAERAPLTTSALIDEVHAALLKVPTRGALPKAIHRAASGDFDAFLALAVPSDSRFMPRAEATYLSIVCPEETASIEPEPAERLAAGTFVGMHFVDEVRMACEIWGRPPHPEYPIEPRSSDISVLIVAGGRDPITPIEYGRRIGEDFPNATLLAIEPMPHHSTGLPGSGKCLERILFEFVTAGRMDGIDVTCVSELESAPFELPDEPPPGASP